MKTPLWTLNNVEVAGDGGPRLSIPDLNIPAGVTAVVGPSGAGKTTLLDLLAGFQTPHHGTVHRAPTPSNQLGVFWSPADAGLWPNMTVLQHVAAVLPTGTVAERSAAAQRWLDRFGLSDLAAAYPERLSAGEAARVSLARAVATGASILVLDEPAAHLDAHHRRQVWNVLNSLVLTNRTSIVFSTHAGSDALEYADHVVVLSGGRLAAAGSVDDVYSHPVNEEVAWSLGPANWFADGDAVEWLAATPYTSQTHACVRPEQLSLEADEKTPLRLIRLRPSGSISVAEIEHCDSQSKKTLFVSPPQNSVEPGQRVRLVTSLCCLLSVLLTGCDLSTEGPRLPISTVNYWAVPNDGTKTPAPRAVSFGRPDEVFVLDNAGRVVLYDDQGNIRRHWFMPEYSVGRPEGICRLLDGRIAVADTHYHRVVLFDDDGNVVSQWGKLGLEQGEFIYPIAIMQSPDGGIYVSEYGEYGQKDRVQKFSPDGKFLLEFGRQGTGPGEFMRPSGLGWYDSQIFVADAFNNRILLFSEAGDYRGVFGGDSAVADLNYPYDLAIDGDGNVYVVEYGAGRVSRFNRSGRLTGRFGRSGAGEEEFSTPWGIAVDRRGRVLVADTGNRRIVELLP